MTLTQLVHMYTACAKVDEVLLQAQTVSSSLVDQRRVFDSVSDKVLQVRCIVPVARTIYNCHLPVLLIIDYFRCLLFHSNMVLQLHCCYIHMRCGCTNGTSTKGSLSESKHCLFNLDMECKRLSLLFAVCQGGIHHNST